ncbi:MAG TPA: hypothetical protein VGL38_00025 [bacterium]
MSNRSRQRGFVMVLAALLIVGLMTIATVAVRRTQTLNDQSQRAYHEARVFYVAEGGADVAADWLRNAIHINTVPSQSDLNDFHAPTVPDYVFPQLTIAKQPVTTTIPITQGAYAGMNATVQPYLIVSHAANSKGTVDQVVRVTVNREGIGMYQFGIYYDHDLEMFPAYPLDFNGRIHTNGNLYIGSSDVLNINGSVTAGGHIYNTPKDPTQYYNGKARITDVAGHWHDLSYDSRDPNWQRKSLEDWQGRVKDVSQGTTALAFPLSTPAFPIDVIKRGQPGDDEELRAKRYYYKAGLKIIDGIATDSTGNPIALPVGVLTSSNVWDFREQKTMHMTNVNIGLLASSGMVPSNRTIYFCYTDPAGAIRLVNGATLPAGGLSIATENPLYVWGNFNTVNKKACSILCDAFNVYSNNWSDGNATKSINQRGSSATTVNSCVVAGNTETTSGDYNGGAENLIRLHEKWVGHELTYRGSLVCIWNSQRATGDFRNASYVEAHRDWGYDQSLLDPSLWPPDMISVQRTVRARWQG